MLVGTSQTIAVQPRYYAKTIDGADCVASNDKGAWSFKAPGSVTVHRSDNAISVACSAPGYVSGVAAANSETKDLAWGNLLFGGLIGGAVDAGTGAAYDYPAMILVPLQPLPGMMRIAPTS